MAGGDVRARLEAKLRAKQATSDAHLADDASRSGVAGAGGGRGSAPGRTEELDESMSDGLMSGTFRCEPASCRLVFIAAFAIWCNAQGSLRLYI
jgi:hypothetical protein